MAEQCLSRTETWSCRRCKHDNDRHARYCSTCGLPTDDVVEPHAAPDTDLAVDAVNAVGIVMFVFLITIGYSLLRMMLRLI